jgi:hypothetical protein
VYRETIAPPPLELASLKEARRKVELTILETAAGAPALDPDVSATESIIEEIRGRERRRKLSAADVAVLDRLEVELVTSPLSIDDPELREHLAREGIERGLRGLRELVEMVASHDLDGARGLVCDDGRLLLGDAPEFVELRLRRAVFRRIYLRAHGIVDIRDPSTWEHDGHPRPAFVEPRGDVLDVLGLSSHGSAAEALGAAVTEDTTHGDLLSRVLRRVGLRRKRARKVRGVVHYAMDRDLYDAQMRRCEWLVGRTIRRGGDMQERAERRERPAR